MLTLRVVTYNLFSRPLNYSLGAQERCSQIPLKFKELESNVGSIDVIFVQELWDFGAAHIFFKACADQGWLYHTKLLNSFGPMNGGVAIVSKYPIENIREKAFTICSTMTTDCLSPKGVMHALIMIQGQKFHFFNTHLQSSNDNQPWGSLEEQSIRKKQMTEIQNFIVECCGSGNDNNDIDNASSPVIVGGDWNTDRILDFKSVEEDLSIVNCSLPPVKGSFSTTYASENALFGMDGCGSNARPMWIDYVCVSNMHKMPIPSSSSLEAFRLKSTEVIQYGDRVSGHDLSDHYCVLASFTFQF